MDIRTDSIKLDSVFTEEGYLIDTPIISCCTVLEYINDDGTIRREARLPEHVFEAESLASLEGKPIVLTHKTSKDGLVDTDNVKETIIGTILSKGYQDGDNLRCKIIIHDMDALKNTPYRELSLSYIPIMVEQAGEYNGSPYDQIQTNIVYNNLAVVAKARAGSDCRLNLDEKENEEMEEKDINMLEEQEQITVDANEAIDSGIFEEDKGLTQDSEDKSGILDKIRALKSKKDAGGSIDATYLILDILEEIIDDKKDIIEEKKLLATDAENSTEEGLAKEIFALEERAKQYYDKENEEVNYDAVAEKEEEKPNVNMDSVDALVRKRARIAATATKINLDGIEDMTIPQAQRAIIKKAMPTLRIDGLDLETAYSIAEQHIGKRKPISKQYSGIVHNDGIPPIPKGTSSALAARESLVNRIHGGDK